LLVVLLELQRPVRGQSAVETVARGEASSTTSTPWVLCIDDDQDLSRSLQLRLEAHGVAVVRASGGMEGYRYAFRYPADAIILDYNLPDGRGDYVLRRLKENPATKDLPVIVLTGVTDHSVERTLRNLGAAGYFTKPIVFPQLLAELAKHVDVLEHAAV
jgi:DNA-binding response OmpR family regulator